MPVYELEDTAGDSTFTGDDGEKKAFKVQILPEDTICEAEITEVKEKVAPFTNDDGSEIRRVEFTFYLPEYNQKVWGETPTTFSNHPDCKLRGWAQEILGGQELPKGFKLNTDNLVGSKVRVRLGYKKYFSKKYQKDVEQNPVVDVIHSRSALASTGTFAEEPF